MTNEKYYVYGNLNHNGKAYVRGDAVELSEADAAPLIEAGVVGTEGVSDPAVRAEAPAEAPEAAPVVGGEPNASGEPSIDANEPAATQGEAVDVTPVVSERMTRAELEEMAAKKGINNAAVEAAATKADLVELIQSTGELEPAPAESEAVDASADL